MDWSTLSLAEGNLVGHALAQRHTDILYAVELQSGGDALIYILHEHQSQEDPFMTFRVLGYQVRIWERYCRANPRAARLPMIIPVVLYHGPSAWQGAQDFHSLLDIPESLQQVVGPFRPQFRFCLDDLSGTSPAEIRRRPAPPLVRLALGLLHSARFAETVEQLLDDWLELLQEVGLSNLETAIYYICSLDCSISIEGVVGYIEKKVDPQARGVVMTILEKLKDEGRQEGRQEGELAMFRRLLTLKFSANLPAFVDEKLQSANLEDLERWTANILTASSVEDVFRDG